MCELSRASVTVAALVANFEGEEDLSHHNGRILRLPKTASPRRPPVHPSSGSGANYTSHPIRRQKSGTSLQESECSVTVTLPMQSRKTVDNSEESSAESRNGTSCSPPAVQQGNNSTSDCSEEEEEDTSTCSDGDFTWMCSQPESTPPPVANTTHSNNQQHQPQHSNQQRGSTASPATGPLQHLQQEPRSCSSLDRRRPANRALRDQKSRSTHTLRCDTWDSNNRENRCAGRSAMHELTIPPPPPHCDGTSCCEEAMMRILPPRCRCEEQQTLQRLHCGDCSRSSRHTSPFMHCCERWGMPWPTCYQRPGPAEDRIRRLEADKEQLRLQVGSLSDQLTAQTERVAGLERALQDKQKLLHTAEDALQREMLSRSSLETQKLELMSALSEFKLHQASLERENLDLRRHQHQQQQQQQPSFNSDQYQSYQQHLEAGRPPAAPRTSTPAGSPANMSPLNLTTQQSPALYRNLTTHGSLPRHFTSGGVGGSLTLQRPNSSDDNANHLQSNGSPQRRGVAFGKPRPLVQTIRGFSVPNLAETEQIILQDINSDESSNTISSQTKTSLSSPLSIRHNKGLRGIFGKMKRSSSGNLETVDDGTGTFARGGVRATAGGRLGWTENHEQKLGSDIPFKEWERERVLSWIQNDLGVDVIENEPSKTIITNGSKLLDATPSELEKAFTIKSHLHRKKLTLALNDIRGTSDDEHLKNAGKWDTAWVLRWLDDAGLPQYKDPFLQAQIDGRMLHRLNMDDIAALHITSLLHVASLRRGIQVLREHQWSDDTLIRRSQESDPEIPGPEHVSRWSAHRVMEWLKQIDLSEYATNLRGAGVHGGLIVHEPRFSSDLLAALLSIPANKTLLRRHLTTHFKELLGRDIMQNKREAEATLGLVPLTLTTKVKVPKKSQFSLKRHKGPTLDDLGELVCPLNEKVSGEPTTPLPMMKNIVEQDASESLPADNNEK